MDTDLKQKVEMLKASELFVHYGGFAKNIEKQEILLALTGLKPVSQTATSRMIVTDTSAQATTEDHNKIANLMTQLGLYYLIEDSNNSTVVTVTKNQPLLGRYLSSINTPEELYKLFGCPETVARAYKDDFKLMPFGDQEKLLNKVGLPEYMPTFRLSKLYYEEEIKTLISWYETLKYYDLLS